MSERLSRNSKRAHRAYAAACNRAYAEFVEQLTCFVQDFMDRLYDHFPVAHDQDATNSLYHVVMKQLDQLLANTKDMTHIAFIEMENDKVDWLAQPYFRGQQVLLSSIIDEYNAYYRNPTFIPSDACQHMFRMKVQPVQENAASSSYRMTSSEWSENDSKKRSRDRDEKD